MQRLFLRRVVAGAVVLSCLAAGSACASDGADSSTVTLTISDFGNFGYKTLLKEYHEQNPQIRIVERVEEYAEHHENLAKQLDAGRGAADVVAIDEGYIAQFRDRPNGFYNLLEMGASTLKSRWLEWKWRQSLSADGSVQIGLGTDIGGLAICYRRDMFEQAGLPTERDLVGRLWTTWEDYLRVGRVFERTDVPAHWVDSSLRVFNAVLAQQEFGYYDTTGTVVVATNPGVRRSFDLALQVIEAGTSARLTPNTDPWTAGLQTGKFATMMCPAWALGHLQQNAPETRGKWDIATVPGGGGNWGGSFLAVPKQSRYARAAYQLAAWLTAPEQQMRIFKETGNLPSQPALYDDVVLREFRNEFVNDAPVGQIFGASAAKLKPQYLGPRNGAIREVFEGVLTRVETGQLTESQAWATALSEVGAAVGN